MRDDRRLPLGHLMSLCGGLLLLLGPVLGLEQGLLRRMLGLLLVSGCLLLRLMLGLDHRLLLGGMGLFGGLWLLLGAVLGLDQGLLLRMLGLLLVSRRLLLRLMLGFEHRLLLGGMGLRGALLLLLGPVLSLEHGLVLLVLALLLVGRRLLLRLMLGFEHRLLLGGLMRLGGGGPALLQAFAVLGFEHRLLLRDLMRLGRGERRRRLVSAGFSSRLSIAPELGLGLLLADRRGRRLANPCLRRGHAAVFASAGGPGRLGQRPCGLVLRRGSGRGGEPGRLPP